MEMDPAEFWYFRFLDKIRFSNKALINIAEKFWSAVYIFNILIYIQSSEIMCQKRR